MGVAANAYIVVTIIRAKPPVLLYVIGTGSRSTRSAKFYLPIVRKLRLEAYAIDLLDDVTSMRKVTTSAVKPGVGRVHQGYCRWPRYW